MIKILQLWCLAFLLAGSAAPAAETTAGAFENANRLYEQGNYQEAAAAYEQVVSLGDLSGPILFNLGNAQSKAGHLGRAIAAYRQALLLSPRDPDIEANLRFIRNQVSGPVWRPSRGEAWLKKLSLNEWTVLTAVAWWLTLACATARILRPAWKGALRGWLITFCIFTVGLTVLLGVAFYQARSVVAAVVISPNASVRFGPLQESNLAFAAADGAELRVLDRKEAWLQVASDNRRSGWIRQDQVTLSPGP